MVLSLALAAELERRGAHDRTFIDRCVDGYEPYLAHARAHTPERVPEGTPTTNIADVSRPLLDDTLDPPIRAVFIYNQNPVAIHPEQNRTRHDHGRRGRADHVRLSTAGDAFLVPSAP